MFVSNVWKNISEILRTHFQSFAEEKQKTESLLGDFPALWLHGSHLCSIFLICAIKTSNYGTVSIPAL